MIRFSAVCKWLQKSLMYVTFHSAELWFWIASIASWCAVVRSWASGQGQPVAQQTGSTWLCFSLSGVAHLGALTKSQKWACLHGIPLTGWWTWCNVHALVLVFTAALLRPRAVRVSDTKTVPRGVGRTADALVSCQIDPLSFKLTCGKLSHYSLFFHLVAVLQVLTNACSHVTTTVKTWKSSISLLLSPPSSLSLLQPVPRPPSAPRGCSSGSLLHLWAEFSWLACLVSSVHPRGAGAGLPFLLAAPAFSYFFLSVGWFCNLNSDVFRISCDFSNHLPASF